MDSQFPIYVRSHDGPAFYRMVRAIIRIGLRLFFPRLRLLNRERLERPGPAILLVTHPHSLAAALLLMSALDRQVHCLLPSGELLGVFRKLAAWALGMQAVDLNSEQDAWLKPCLNALASQEAVALFSEKAPSDGAPPIPVADFAARLSLETVLRNPESAQPVIYPVHCFVRTGRRTRAALMCAERSIASREFLPKVGESVTAASQQLAEVVQKSISDNAFGLPEVELEHFGEELEHLSREHLRQEWSLQPNWKQRPEDLELSSFARQWIIEQNRTDPARLVELRQSMTAYRAARRRASLGKLMVETSGPWQGSRRWVTAAWIETILGLPVAVYGLINHFPALIILWANGLLRNSPTRDPKVEWLWRIFIVLSSYTLQVFLVHFWWGRAAAGYYALTLPVSGGYLWRYRWLVQHRVHVLVQKLLHPVSSTRAARERASILETFSHALEHSAQSTVPRARSAGLAQ